MAATKNTSSFTIAAAQSSSVKGDIEENIRRHCEIAALADSHGAHVIVFPELSLTGYEPTVAAELAVESAPGVVAGGGVDGAAPPGCGLTLAVDWRYSAHRACWRATSASTASLSPASSAADGMRSTAPVRSALILSMLNASGLARSSASIMLWMLVPAGRTRSAMDHKLSPLRTGP